MFLIGTYPQHCAFWSGLFVCLQTFPCCWRPLQFSNARRSILSSSACINNKGAVLKFLSDIERNKDIAFNARVILSRQLSFLCQKREKLLPNNANSLFLANVPRFNTPDITPDAVVDGINKNGQERCQIRRCYWIGRAPTNPSLWVNLQGNPMVLPWTQPLPDSRTRCFLLFAYKLILKNGVLRVVEVLPGNNNNNKNKSHD